MGEKKRMPKASAREHHNDREIDDGKQPDNREKDASRDENYFYSFALLLRDEKSERTKNQHEQRSQLDKVR
jgi:hypothetical protein